MTAHAETDMTSVTRGDGGLAGSVGRSVFAFFASAREMYAILVGTLYYVARGRRDRDAVIRQMFEIGNKSLFLLTVVIGSIGMIFVLQAGLQMQRVIPDLSMLGASFLELLVRDLAPSMVALMLATRVGAGIAAEIGSMIVTEQVDALRMCAADPLDYLVKPRFIACLVMTTVLTMWSGAVSVGSGILTANIIFQVNPRTFWNLSLVHASDLATGLTKCVAYGAAIPIVSSHCGLSTFGGSEGVGSATTRAVVQSSLAVIVLNFIISSAAFLVFR